MLWFYTLVFNYSMYRLFFSMYEENISIYFYTISCFIFFLLNEKILSIFLFLLFNVVFLYSLIFCIGFFIIYIKYRAMG